MDEKTTNELLKLTQAVRALAKSVERAVVTGTAAGTGAMVVKNYRSLQSRAAELLSDDYYVTDTLKLDDDTAGSEEEMIAQVRLAVSQLLIYLEGQAKAERPRMEEVEDWQTLGRDLQDQILNLTKRTLKRAFKHVDFGFRDEETEEETAEEEEGKPKRRFKVRIITGDDIPEPPEPPMPPKPPSPPKPPVV